MPSVATPKPVRTRIATHSSTLNHLIELQQHSMAAGRKGDADYYDRLARRVQRLLRNWNREVRTDQRITTSIMDMQGTPKRTRRA